MRREDEWRLRKVGKRGIHLGWSRHGKQSRDKFLFIGSAADDFDDAVATAGANAEGEMLGPDGEHYTFKYPWDKEIGELLDTFTQQISGTKPLRFLFAGQRFDRSDTLRSRGAERVVP